MCTGLEQNPSDTKKACHHILDLPKQNQIRPKPRVQRFHARRIFPTIRIPVKHRCKRASARRRPELQPRENPSQVRLKKIAESPTKTSKNVALETAKEGERSAAWRAHDGDGGGGSTGRLLRETGSNCFSQRRRHSHSPIDHLPSFVLPCGPVGPPPGSSSFPSMDGWMC